MRATENTKIRDYYMTIFPTDDLGREIDGDRTFGDLFDCLDCYHDVYDLIGVRDSVIRERLFSALAELMGVPYREIYDQWMMA